MAGRHAKPLQLHLLNGNKRHLTKEEIAEREEQESKLRSKVKTYKPNPMVKKDAVANAMFKKLKKLYESIEYVEGLDENVINRYCLLHAEYIRLIEMRQELEERYTETEFEKKIMIADRITDADSQINKKMDLLLKLEDRLFLNPTARIKNVPKKKEDPKEPSKFEKMFGDV